MTVGLAFDLFKSALEITQSEQDAAKSSQAMLRDRLGGRLAILDDFLSGSYKRDTKIRPLSDIDLFLVLDPGCFTLGPARVLGLVASHLRASYPTSRLRVQNRSVNLALIRFGFDVVPAFHRRGGGFLIPSMKSNSWVSTDPKAHEIAVSNANLACGGKLKPLIKMVKCWNRTRKDRLQSFHLEVMALEVISPPVYDYQTTALRFFVQAADRIQSLCFDPAGLGPPIDDYLTRSGRLAATRQLMVAARLAARALEFERRRHSVAAIAVWRQVFGKPFPVPA
jgi:hypothetical protein